MVVEELVNFWQDGGGSRTSKRAVDEVILNIDEDECGSLVKFAGELGKRSVSVGT